MSDSVSSVQRFYQNILGRAPDSVGLSTYVTQAANGQSLDSIQNSFIFSPEAQAFTFPIVQLYQAVFNRAPDQAGLALYISQFRSGTSLSAIAQTFASAPEGQGALGTPGGLTTAQLITTVYQNALGRAATTSEINARLGQSQGFILADVASSGEARGRQLGGTISFLQSAGQGNYPTAGGALNRVTVNQQTLTYTGTASNDLFFAPTIFNGLGLQSNTIQNSNVFNGNGGNDTVQVALIDKTVASPTFNGIQTVQLVNSPTVPGGQIALDLANSTGVTTLDAVGDAGAGITFRNATTATTTSLQNSSGAVLNLIGNGALGLGLTTATLSNSAGSILNTAFLTSPTVTLNVSNSPSTNLANTAINYSSFGSAAFVQNVNLNLAGSPAGTLASPDILNITDGTGFAGNLKTLAITSGGTSRVGLAGGNLLGAGVVTVSSPSSGAATDNLALAGAFTRLSTFNSGNFLGSLTVGRPTTNLSAAAGGGNFVTGITAANAGLTITAPTTLTAITTGAGGDVVDLTGQTSNSAFSVALGGGNDTLFLGGGAGSVATTTKGSFDGGSGSNTVGISNGLLTTSGDTFANFQVLEVGRLASGSLAGSGGTGTYKLSNLAGLQAVTVTGSGGGGNDLTGPVVLDVVPDALTLALTASQGVNLVTGPVNPVTVNLAQGPASNNRTISVALNANDAAVSAAAAGTVTLSTLNLRQAVGFSAGFTPGTFTETVNIGSNINTPGNSPAPIPNNAYNNQVGTLSIPDATALNVTNQARLTIGALDFNGQTPQLASIKIGTAGGSNNAGAVSIGAFTDSALTSVDAGASVGSTNLIVTRSLVTSAATKNFSFVGSSGAVTATANAATSLGGGAGTGSTDQFAFSNNNQTSATTFATSTFTGGAGNDFFTLGSSTGSDVFVYNAPTDATIGDNNAQGILIQDGGVGASVAVGDTGAVVGGVGVKISVETISGFTATTTANVSKADVLDFRSLRISSGDVFISGAAGTNFAAGVPGSTSPITNQSNLASQTNLFAGNAANQFLRTAAQIANSQPGSFVTAGSTNVVGAFVYQADNNNVYVFADANNDRSFTAQGDVGVRLFNAGGFTSADVQNIAADIRFN